MSNKKPCLAHAGLSDPLNGPRIVENEEGMRVYEPLYLGVCWDCEHRRVEVSEGTGVLLDKGCLRCAHPLIGQEDVDVVAKKLGLDKFFKGKPAWPGRCWPHSFDPEYVLKCKGFLGTK